MGAREAAPLARIQGRAWLWHLSPSLDALLTPCAHWSRRGGRHKREATGGGGRLNAATGRDMPERERIGDRETMHSMNMGSPIEKLHSDAEFP